MNSVSRGAFTPGRCGPLLAFPASTVQQGARRNAVVVSAASSTKAPSAGVEKTRLGSSGTPSHLPFNPVAHTSQSQQPVVDLMHFMPFSAQDPCGERLLILKETPESTFGVGPVTCIKLSAVQAWRSTSSVSAPGPGTIGTHSVSLLWLLIDTLTRTCIT